MRRAPASGGQRTRSTPFVAVMQSLGLCKARYVQLLLPYDYLLSFFTVSDDVRSSAMVPCFGLAHSSRVADPFCAFVETVLEQ